MVNKISVVISAYNEEKVLVRCLKSVRWADQIIVIDNSSTDSTKEIAQKYATDVFSQPNQLMLNINKNYGFGKAKSDWILNLDADEEVTPELKDEILRIINSENPFDGYWIPRKNIIFGKWIQHGLWWPDKQLRLFKRSNGKFNCQRIHEYVQVDGTIGEIKEPYIHYNYESISQYITKLDRCTTSEAIELLDTQYKYNWADAIKFPVSDFVKIFFAQHGYMDGLHGLVLALLQSFYSFTTFTKLWEKDKFVQKDITLNLFNTELTHAHHELDYWEKTSQLETTHDPSTKFLLKIRRKLKI
jgi:glycosyltransferase involved in cell wall biosynthesis